MRRILFVTHSCYLDSSNGAAVASRTMMQGLASQGWPVEALCGTGLELQQAEVDAHAWLEEHYGAPGWVPHEPLSIDGAGLRRGLPEHFRLSVHGVPVTLHASPSTRPHRPGEEEVEGFLTLFESILRRFRPEVVVGYGGDSLAREVFRRASTAKITTVFMLHSFQYRSPIPFADVDVTCVPSHFAARYYHTLLGLDCRVLPNLVDRRRSFCEHRDPRFLTFVTPTPEKGLWPFARLAQMLGARRPDIPILVVEGRGTETDLAGCGVDLRDHGNVFLMAHTADPKKFWRRTRLCVMPSVWWENQPLTAIEAMQNGIPVVGSDRGGIPETLGAAGVVLPLPDRITPQTRVLPTEEEMTPWIEAIIRIWDDPALALDLAGRSLKEAGRWDYDELRRRHIEFFTGLGASESHGR